MEDRGSIRSAGALVRIQHSLSRLEREEVQMDQRTGLVKQALLRDESIVRGGIHQVSTHGGAEGRSWTFLVAELRLCVGP